MSAAIDTVVMTTQATVNWGLIFFGSDNMCGVNATPNVAIAANDYTAISQAYANSTPGSYTPTRTAVDAAAAYMETVTDTNPKYLLLATDGLPNCIPGDSNVGDDDSAGAKTAVMNAATAGFKTFVVGIGNTNGVATLNQLAMAGGEAQVGSADGNSFYEVNSTADLVTALNKIVGMVASCTIPLTGVNGTLEKVAVSAKDASRQHGRGHAGPDQRLVVHRRQHDDHRPQRYRLQRPAERGALRLSVHLHLLDGDHLYRSQI